jgi:hypothetical protein
MRSEFDRVENEKRKADVRRLFITTVLFSFLVSCGGQSFQSRETFPSPVAFVTPEPLPEAPPTLTAVPLPTLAPPPATAIPKKQPQSSASTIGLWSDRIEASTNYTGFLDIALGSGANDYRGKNQFLLTLTSGQVFAGYEDRIDEIQKSNPNWVLYDKNKKVALSTSTDEPLLNIRNDEVKTQLADEMFKRAASYDGILLNGVGVDLIRVSNTPIFSGTQTFTEVQRRDAVEGLLRAIRAKLPDKIVLIGGYVWKDGSAFVLRSNEAQDLSAIVDGIHIEEFVRAPISKTNEFKTETNWKRDIDYLSSTSQDNKIVLVTTRIDASQAGVELTKQWLNYSVASYLLGKNGDKTYFQFDAGNASWSTDPVLSAPVGAPSEAYSKLESGVYSRKFEKGLVLLNPTGEQKKAGVTGSFRSLQGNLVDTSVTLPARTGIVLLKQ